MKEVRPLAENSRPESPGSKIHSSCQRGPCGFQCLASSHYSDLFLDGPLICGHPSGPGFRTLVFSQRMTEEETFLCLFHCVCSHSPSPCVSFHGANETSHILPAATTPAVYTGGASCHSACRPVVSVVSPGGLDPSRPS